MVFLERSARPACTIVLALVALAFVTGCAAKGPSGGPEPVPEIRPGILQGYIAQEENVDSLALLPPPPAQDSVAFELDQKISQANLALRGTARWELASKDNGLHFPEAAETFSCALGAAITQESTPHLYQLIRRTLADAGLATYGAKNHYQRTRPFVANGAPTCATAKEEEYLRKDGSYPSGHTAAGWAWALILAELAPDRIDAILARGRAFGQSRVVCNVHWQSDVIEGRVVGAAAVGRLHADPTFRKDLEAARAELASARAAGSEPARDCAAEAEAMGLIAPEAPWPSNFPSTR
ncbi:MAG: phosphatase PAP2 family protein [Deltaproteobacteria bacterium]|nr:phosphatase PAP2 family protein [Deltaproteobacteria bacterium]